MSNTDKKIAFLLFGPPTCGKTSHAQHLVEQTGGILIAGKSILPDLNSRYEPKRQCIPDQLFVPALINVLNQTTGNPVIFDNIPRTIEQAINLLGWAKQYQYLLTGAQLTLSLDEVLQRSAVRLVCSSCQTPYHPQLKPPLTPGFCDNDNNSLISRQGDDPEIIRKAYSKRQKSDADIINYLAAQSINFVSIEASGPLANVYSHLIKLLS